MGEEERDILNLREASEFLNCHPSTIYRLVKTNQIPAFRLGGSWGFVKPELNRWIKRMMEWPGHDNDRAARPVEPPVAKVARSSPPSHRRRKPSSPISATPKAKGRRSYRRV
jgi:excisionase family DNA binding protein